MPGANACFILAADGARGVLPPDPRRLSVSDEDAWVVATVIRGPQSGHVRLRRDDAPPGVDIEVERPEAEVAACSIVSDSEPTLAACEDIVGLGDVNFGAMLHSFRLRLEKDRIFTNIGPVLVVMNPYRARHLRDAFTKPRPPRKPSLRITDHSTRALWAHSARSATASDVLGDASTRSAGPVDSCAPSTMLEMAKKTSASTDANDLPPHAHSSVARAYSSMVQGKHGTPQSVLVSGESGAGKTETIKLCMAALANISRSTGSTTEAALESGLLLEAFGNAMTVYNHNSSRFGKWCALLAPFCRAARVTQPDTRAQPVLKLGGPRTSSPPTSTLSRLHLDFISAPSRLHLGSISAPGCV